ncbi:MAG TPA: cellulase family glycosylhydrolase [Ignavibacteriaceae bacterium]|nr:cellulase family glycosylhydrolase [Ignavibacteriaceae bacterium]
MKFLQKFFFIFFLIFFSNILNLSAQGFLHRQNKIIVNGSGQEILLKGIGLGGWLVQEGYMLQTSNFANAQWEIRAKIADLVGESNTELFYEKYRNNYVRKVDIDSIKSWGFNSIRLPFHYNLFATNTSPPTFIHKGFEIIDSLLSWCEANQIYLILDMHAAPGGQSANNISDYNPNFPSLWESNTNKDLTVKIWRQIAERYNSKEWIGGYDLLNEPAWNLGTNNQPLRDLYIRITDTVRAVDQNHLIFIEGNWYATDFPGLTPPWDENMAYSFHKYWNGNTQSSIQYLVDIRNTTNRPLWLGETGENSNKWFVDCVELMKTNNIGWAWWPHKKIESISGPLSAYKVSGYQTLLNYWNGTVSRPSAIYAYNALMAQANALLFENCRYQKDVVDALIRQPFNNTTIPFASNQIPGIIQATEYDLGKMSQAYNDVDYQNIGSGNTTWNSGWSFRNDGVDIESCGDFNSNGFDVGWIATGDWLKYTINVQPSGLYDIKLNIAAPSAGGKIFLSMDGQSLTPLMDVPATGGWQSWRYITAPAIFIPAGVHKLQANFYFGGYNFSYMDFVLVATDVEDKSQIPLSFELEQNFPNPFNPTTKIKYTIPSIIDGNLSTVKLKVYDLLGNEIATLVNERQSEGKYEIDFNGLNLSSGVYFYRLQFGNYTAMKKMILLR